MTVQEFIVSLGGVSEVSRKMGLPITTVHAWVRRNNVPDWRIGALAQVAVAAGKAVPAQFGEAA